MILDTLSMRNFRHHIETDIKFGRGLIAIVGPNGAGKSTILEGICVALFGSSAAFTTQNRLRSDLNDGPTRLRLSFTVGPDSVEVAREPGAATVFVNGKAEASGARAAVDYITNHVLNADWEEWRNTSFAAQIDKDGRRGLDWLRSKGRVDRERFLAGQLGYGLIQTAQALTRDDAKKDGARLEAIEAMVRDPEELTHLITSKSAEVTEQEAVVYRLTAQVDHAKGLEANLLASVQAMEASEEQHRTLEKAEAAQKETVREVERRVAELTAQRSGIVEALDELDRKADAVVHLDRQNQLWHEARATFDQGMKEQRAKLTTLQVSEHEAEREAILAGGNLIAAKSAREALDEIPIDDADCPTCLQPIDTKKVAELIAEADAKVETAQVRKNTADYAHGIRLSNRTEQEKQIQAEEHEWSERFGSVEAAEAEVSAYHKSVEESQARRQKVGALDEQIRSAEAEMQAERATLEERSKAVSDSGYYREEHTRRRTAHREQAERLSTAVSQLHEAEKQLTTLVSALDALKADEGRNNALREEATKLSLRLVTVRATDRMFGQLQTHLTERIRPALSERATKLITEMTTGRFTGLWLDDDYRPVLTSGNRKIPMASGGEWDVANLALRLATGQLIAERGARSLDLVMFDEPLGFLDESREAAVVDGLRNLSEFEQIVLVTHSRAVVDVADQLIQVSLATDETAHVHVS